MPCPRWYDPRGKDETTVPPDGRSACLSALRILGGQDPGGGLRDALDVGAVQDLGLAAQVLARPAARVDVDLAYPEHLPGDGRAVDGDRWLYGNLITKLAADQLAGLIGLPARLVQPVLLIDRTVVEALVRQCADRQPFVPLL